MHRRFRRVPRALSLAGLLAGLLIVPAVSSAATISLPSSTQLDVTGTGASEDLQMTHPTAEKIHFRLLAGGNLALDPSATTDCILDSTVDVTCDWYRGGAPPITQVQLLMGDGDDTIRGGSPNSTLGTYQDGQNGSDTYRPSADSVGRDLYFDTGSGPGDVNTIDYAEAGAPVYVSPTAFPTNGRGCRPGDARPCEGDYIQDSIENVSGTPYDDVLIGTIGDNTLLGRGGKDSLDGLGGADTLDGGSGADVLQGGAGADRLLAADGEADTTIDCGDDVDSLVRDAVDPAATACENVTTQAVAPTAGTVTVTGDGHVGGTLAAPATFDGTASQLSYSWQLCDPAGRNCARVAGTPTFAITEAYMGKRPRVTVTAVNSAGVAQASSLEGIVGRTPSPNCSGLSGAGDSDGDGILDFTECNIVQYPNSLEYMDLPSLGADPLHKDIFLEIDTMPGLDIEFRAVTLVMQAFNSAPVNNVSGGTGIHLHVDFGTFGLIGPGESRTWKTLSRATTDLPFKAVLGSFSPPGSKRNYDWSDIDVIKRANFDRVRASAFHYAVVGHRYGSPANNSSGLARVSGRWTPNELGQDTIMTLGGACPPIQRCAGSVMQQAGTIMHELGHTLGLAHGGRAQGVPDGTNGKPNYPSIMNYRWQMGGITRTNRAAVLDYSRYGSGSLGALDERKLSLRKGLTASGGAAKLMGMRTCGTEKTKGVTFILFKPNTRVNWACGGKKPASGFVSNDANGDGLLSGLKPNDDWDNLVYIGGAIGDAGASSAADGTVTLVDVPPTPQAARTVNVDADSSIAMLVKAAGVATGDSAAPVIRVRLQRLKKKHRARLKITIRDKRQVADVYMKVNRKRFHFRPARKRLARKVLLKKGRHKVLIVTHDAVGNRRAYKRTYRVK